MKILKIFFAMIIVFSFFSLYGCGGKGGSDTPNYRNAP
jgi:predicted small lipoprotein YifL